MSLISKNHSLKKVFKAPVKNGHTSTENINKTIPGPKSEKSTQPNGYSDISVVGSSQPISKETKIKTIDKTIPKPLPKVKSSNETRLEKKAQPMTGQKSFKEVKAKKEKSLTESEYEEIFSSVLFNTQNDNTNVENPKPKEKSLTEAEYEKIFSSVLFNTQNDNTNVENLKPKEVDNKEGKHKLPKAVDDDQSKVKKQRLYTAQLTDDSSYTPEFEDLAVEKKKMKKVKKIDSTMSPKSVSSAGLKTPPSKRPPLVQISPWGSHFAKLNSQGSLKYKLSDDSQSIVESLFVDDDDDDEESSDQDGNVSSVINKSDKKVPAEVDNEGEYVPVDSENENKSISSDSDSEKEITSSQIVKQKSQTGNIERVLNISSDLRSRLEMLHEDRDVGLWVYCSHKSCQKQRYMPHIKDPLDLPNKWYCNMNPDPMHNSCDKPEHGPSEEEEEYLINNLYNAGSLVWARLDGYPWWPAMVDDCPDYEEYYWLEDSLTPTWYNVVFFDDNVTRAWLKPHAIAPYIGFETAKQFKETRACGIDYRARLTTAKKQAADAATLSIYERLKKYSFIARYKKPLNNKTKRLSKQKNVSKTIKAVPMKAKPRKQQQLKGNEIKKIKDASKILLKEKKQIKKGLKKEINSFKELGLSSQKMTNNLKQKRNVEKKSLKDKYVINENDTNLLNSLKKKDCEMTKEAKNPISEIPVLNQLNEKTQSKNNETELETILDNANTAKGLLKNKETKLKMLEESAMKNNESTVLIKKDDVKPEKKLNIIQPGSPNFDLSGEIQNEEVGSTQGTDFENPEENEDSTGIITSTSQDTPSHLQSQELFSDHDVSRSESDAVVPQTGSLPSHF